MCAVSLVLSFNQSGNSISDDVMSDQHLVNEVPSNVVQEATWCSGPCVGFACGCSEFKSCSSLQFNSTVLNSLNLNHFQLLLSSLSRIVWSYNKKFAHLHWIGSPTSAESSGCSVTTERTSPGPAPGSPLASVKFGQRMSRTSPLYGSLKKVMKISMAR